MNQNLVRVALAATLVALGGCASETPTPTMMQTGATTTAGTPAPAPATAGSVAAPSAGSTAPTAGSTGAASNLSSCAGATTTGGPALHAAAAVILLPAAGDAMSNGLCAFSSCHRASTKKANLILDSSITDLRATLVDKAACVVPTMKLVDGSGGDAALKKSWLWQKLVAPADSSGTLTPNADWGAKASCAQSDPTTFGVRMPFGSTDPLAQPKLDAIRNWICAGAPGPM